MEAHAIPAPYARPVRKPAAPPQAKRRSHALPRSRSAERERTAAGTRAEGQSAMKLSFRTASLFIAVIAILLVIVYSYMQVSQLSKEHSVNSLALQALIKEEKMLSRQAEAGVSLADVEAYALSELGMVKPSADQIVYISMAGEDKAEVIPVKGFWGSVKQLFSTAVMKTKEFFD
jgi:cell division protein FtsL